MKSREILPIEERILKESLEDYVIAKDFSIRPSYVLRLTVALEAAEKEIIDFEETIKGLEQSYGNLVDENHILEEENQKLLSKLEKEPDCDHNNTEHQRIRCNVCTDCGYTLEIDI